MESSKSVTMAESYQFSQIESGLKSALTFNAKRTVVTFAILSRLAPTPKEIVIIEGDKWECTDNEETDTYGVDKVTLKLIE